MPTLRDKHSPSPSGVKRSARRVCGVLTHVVYPESYSNTRAPPNCHVHVYTRSTIEGVRVCVQAHLAVAQAGRWCTDGTSSSTRSKDAPLRSNTYLKEQEHSCETPQIRQDLPKTSQETEEK